VVGQGERVASLVTLLVVLVVAHLTVERLHNIAHIVDKKAECVGLGNILIVVKLFHQEGVHVAVFVVVATLAREPLGDVMHADSDVANAALDRVVRLFAFLDPRSVQEVEVRLPHLSVILHIVGKGRCLDEGVVLLVRRERRIVLRQISKHLVGGFEGVWGLVLKQVLSDIGHHEVPVDGPCLASAGQEGSDDD